MARPGSARAVGLTWFRRAAAGARGHVSRSSPSTSSASSTRRSHRPEDIERIVMVAIAPQAKVLDCKMVPFSKTRHGIMGDHYSLTIHATGPGVAEIHTLQLFVKFPTANPVLREHVVDSSVFIEELNFFRRIVPLLRHVYRGPPWCPLHYVAKSSLLVQEDLRTQGYEMRTNSIFDEPTLKSVLSALAKFHASTLLAEILLAEKMNCVYPDLFKEKVYTEVGKGGRSNKLGFDTMQLLAIRFGLDGRILPAALERIRELVKPVEGRCNVICHGDLWRSNLLFKNLGTSLHCVLVDFQMLRYASPTIDVAMVLYVHATPELRKTSETSLLQYYYNVLVQTLTNQKTGEPVIPTFEEIQQDYNERRIIGMAYSAQRWPPSVINNRHDVESLERWYFHNRIDTYCKLMDDDPELEKRMKGYIEELIEESHRIL